eukprot:TRINITY_DN9760_c0_g2_i1.p1 TRINITY_DN9760_c0_g2~~TRINITY_DN9760_c0_g2_i1.p1  ORF type:complete len:595 (+),score=98.35 TRINITY_DN9760_c0_g2_i1:103-1887(+)
MGHPTRSSERDPRVWLALLAGLAGLPASQQLAPYGVPAHETSTSIAPQCQCGADRAMAYFCAWENGCTPMALSPFGGHVGHCDGVGATPCYSAAHDTGSKEGLDKRGAYDNIGETVGCHVGDAWDTDSLICALNTTSVLRCVLPEGNALELPTSFSCSGDAVALRKPETLAVRMAIPDTANDDWPNHFYHQFLNEVTTWLGVNPSEVHIHTMCPTSRCPSAAACPTSESRRTNNYGPPAADDCISMAPAMDVGLAKTWPPAETEIWIDFNVSNMYLGDRLNLFAWAVYDYAQYAKSPGNDTPGVSSIFSTLNVKGVERSFEVVRSWTHREDDGASFPSTATGIIILILFMTLFLFIVIVTLHNKSKGDRKPSDKTKRQADQLDAGFITNEMKVTDGGGRRGELPGGPLPAGVPGGNTARVQKWQEDCAVPKDRDPEMPLGESGSELQVERGVSEGKKWWDANSTKVIMTTDSVSYSSDGMAESSALLDILNKSKNSPLEGGTGICADASSTTPPPRSANKSLAKSDKIVPPKARSTANSVAARPPPEEATTDGAGEGPKTPVPVTGKAKKKKGSLKGANPLLGAAEDAAPPAAV